jgi:SRSO17 transposase
MEARYATRKQQLLAECQIAPTIFEQVLLRLTTFMAPFVETFCRPELDQHAHTYICGLLSDVDRKNIESIAYRFGQDRLPLQRFIGWAPWEDRPLRQELTRQVAEHLGHPDGVLVFDPSGFPKSGTESVGVARQWCGRLGKVDNCQVAVYLGYVSGEGHTLVDMRLYLPKEWTTDKARLDKAGVPNAHRGYRSRHQLALDMLQASGTRLPHGWITGDDEMGRPYWFRRRLHGLGERYMLAVPGNVLIRDLETAPPASSGRGRHPPPPWHRVEAWSASLEEGALAADRRARRFQRAAGGRGGQTTRSGADAAATTRRRGAVSRPTLPRPRQPAGGEGRFLSVQRRAWDTAVAVGPCGQSRTSH